MGVSPHQVQDGEEVGRALDTGDQVELSVVINRKLGTTVAEAVKLVCKAEDKRELGQVGSRQDHLLHAWGLLRKLQAGKISFRLLLAMCLCQICQAQPIAAGGMRRVEVRS